VHFCVFFVYFSVKLLTTAKGWCPYSTCHEKRPLAVCGCVYFFSGRL